MLLLLSPFFTGIWLFGASRAYDTGIMTPEFFTQAYRKGLHLTTRLLLSKGLSIEEAEEFAQSAWARGWEARHQLREPDRIMTWVNTIAMHKMYSAKRSGHREEELQ